ncbi:transposase [Salmonella enterica subsp. enterica serovar Enteritidis str. SARB17]|nr:transposase [Salmonella enterica subsp. enterica serovar Enteritidis str. SARB17]
MAKQKFKITNWPAYNKALRQRGSLTVWLDESAIAAWTDSAPLKVAVDRFTTPIWPSPRCD